jgi:hypothetical protein
LSNCERGLPHDDHGWANYDHRRADDDCIVMFVSRVLMPAAFHRDGNTSGDGEETQGADGQQEQCF